jgi:hypothetical protein
VSSVPSSGHFESLSNWFCGQAWLERKMRFFVFRSGKSRRGSRLANRQPRGVSEGILEGPAPMMRPCLRKNMSSPRYSFPVRKREVEGPQGNVFTERIVHTSGTQLLSWVSWDLVLGLSQLRERERETWLMTWGNSPREDRVNQPVVGESQEVHWPWGGSLWARVAMAALVWDHGSQKSSSDPSKFI